MQTIRIFIFLLLCGSALGACSPTKHSPATEVVPQLVAAQNEAGAWKRIDVKIHWPENQTPDWAIDSLVANEVFAPLLHDSEFRPPLWRFHRRALRDASGHQFAFIFYSTPEQAEKIISRISNDKVLTLLFDRMIVDEVRFPQDKDPVLSAIADTSDPAWSKEVREAWPLYIMGSSGLWLELVGQEARAEKVTSESAQSLLSSYRRVEEKVRAVWAKEGQHAFLHHLNALFGYEPLTLNSDVNF